MKRHPSILSLLFVFPFLLANSPSPYAGPTPYEDFTYTQITIEPHTSLPNHYVYETTLTNAGSGYISLEWIELISFTDETVRIAFSHHDYSNQVIKPNGAFHFTITESVYADDFIIPTVLAYTEIESEIITTIQGPLAWTEEAESLELQIPVTFSKAFEYTYSAIVDMTIEGIPFSWITNMITNDTIYVSLHPFTDIDLLDLDIENIVLVRGRPRTQGFNLYTIVLGIMTVVSVLAGGLTIAGVAFLLMMVLKQIRKKHPRP